VQEKAVPGGLESKDFFTDLSLVGDPSPYFHQLRSRCPVLREHHHGAVMVTGYAEALEVFKQRDVFSSCVAVTGPIPPLPFTPHGDDVTEQISKYRNEMPWSAYLVTLDGQAHGALRGILNGLLTHTRLKKNEEYVQQLCDRLIDGFIAKDRCEFVAEYAHALSTLVIADLLGVPEGDREELLQLLGEPPTQIAGDPAHKSTRDPLAYLDCRFVSYMEERRSHPCGDMMSDLANARFKDGSEPGLDVPVRLAKFLFGAGQDTSARLMASCFRLLGECPHLQHRLRAERNRIPDFIEETLRLESPVKTLSRLTRTTTCIGGVPIAAGSIVTLALGAADRDPRQFAAPDELNIDRSNVRDHVAFSRGAHACPGAPLARAETRITLERFLDRMRDIRICEAEHGPADARRYDYVPTYLLRGLSALHLEFSAA
jgi:cytochrome P450 family 150 subfamily A5